MTAERNSLEAALQSEKAYVRRLEHKMTAGGPDTAARCAQLRSKLKTARMNSRWRRPRPAVSRRSSKRR